MSNINKAVLKLANQNPEFKQALQAELAKTGASVLLKGLAKSFADGKKSAASGGDPGASQDVQAFKDLMAQAQRVLTKLSKVKNWHARMGPGGMATGDVRVLMNSIEEAAWYAGALGVNSDGKMAADKWKKKPKGWTDESRKKFWNTLTSAAPKHKVTECIKRMDKHMGGNAGAFCASLADRVTPGWRKEVSKDKKASLTQPLSLRRDYGAGSDDEWLGIDEVRKHCPPCADKMAANNVRKVKASTLRLAMQRR